MISLRMLFLLLLTRLVATAATTANDIIPFFSLLFAFLSVPFPTIPFLSCPLNYFLSFILLSLLVPFCPFLTLNFLSIQFIFLPFSFLFLSFSFHFPLSCNSVAFLFLSFPFLTFPLFTFSVPLIT